MVTVRASDASRQGPRFAILPPAPPVSCLPSTGRGPGEPRWSSAYSTVAFSCRVSGNLPSQRRLITAARASCRRSSRSIWGLNWVLSWGTSLMHPQGLAIVASVSVLVPTHVHGSSGPIQYPGRGIILMRLIGQQVAMAEPALNHARAEAFAGRMMDVLHTRAVGSTCPAGIDLALEGRALHDVLRHAIAHPRGNCSWTVDHASYVVRRHSLED
jgi:hypothetical protein